MLYCPLKGYFPGNNNDFLCRFDNPSGTYCSASSGCPTSLIWPACGGKGFTCGATVSAYGYVGIVARNGNNAATNETGNVFICFRDPPSGAPLNDGHGYGCIAG